MRYRVFKDDDEFQPESRQCVLLADAMKRTGNPWLSMRAEKIERCGGVDEDVSSWEWPYNMKKFRCYDRLCPICSRRLSFKDRNRILKILGGIDRLWFLTLTIETSSRSELFAPQRYLEDSFRKLKQRRFWRDRIVGGLRFFELSCSKTGFRPHLHLLVDAVSVPTEQIRVAWMAYTEGKGTVDCQGPVPKEEYAKIAQYCVKWWGKWPDPTLLRPDQLVLVAEAIRGKRLLSPFGRLRSWVAR